MKKIKIALLFASLSMIMSSCLVSSTHETTGNPIGKKEGYMKGRPLGKSKIGVAEAAKKGGISKIGSVDINYYRSGKISIRVTGE
jgi:hypothetical protein